MYRVLISNTLISAVAYGLISVIGIVTVGWLVAAYGLASYGIIALARLFLPTGLANILDLGAPENTSHFVATARATGDWNTAGAAILSLALIVSTLSLLPSLLVFCSAAHIAMMFRLDPHDAELLAQSLRYLSIVTPYLLVGAIAEGAIRGFERYGVARSIEVLSVLAYGLGCYLMTRWGWSYDKVIDLGIILAILRATLALLACIRCFVATPIRTLHWRTHGLTRALARTRVTAPNKMLGTIQTQSPGLLVGMLFGPAGAATYDVLTRLPRFAKSVLGLLNSAIMPFISRLEAEEKNVGRITEKGMLLVAVLAAAPLAAAAAFSRPLLELWVGKEMVDYWIWQSLAFMGPLITVLLSFGFNTLFGRLHVNRAANFYIIVRILLQYTIAFLMIHLLQERAFILGGVVAIFITACWEFRIIFREHSIGKEFIARLYMLTLLSAILTAVFMLSAGHIRSLPELALAASAFCLVFWGICWVFIIPNPVKKALIKHSL